MATYSVYVLETSNFGNRIVETLIDFGYDARAFSSPTVMHEWTIPGRVPDVYVIIDSYLEANKGDTLEVIQNIRNYDPEVVIVGVTANYGISYDTLIDYGCTSVTSGEPEDIAKHVRAKLKERIKRSIKTIRQTEIYKRQCSGL